MHSLLLALALFAQPLDPATDIGFQTRSDNGAEHHWAPSAFPLQLRWLEGSSWEEALVAAASFWNAALGENVFEIGAIVNSDIRTWDSSGPRGVVFVRGVEQRSFAEKDTLATARNETAPSGQIHYAVVSFCAVCVPSEDGREEVMIHELGHVLGLEHDTMLPESRMFPKVGKVPAPIVTEGDRARLRARYFSRAGRKAL